jgi:hypothetical protein
VARVTIGTGGDYPVNGSLSTAIYSALNDGHRWLVFIKGDEFDQPINLDLYGGGSLRLEAAGPYIGQFNRDYDSSLGPLFFANTTAWDLHFTGLTFADIHSSSADPAPLCEFRNIGFSYFKNCAWVESNGGGLKLGATQAAVITMIAPKFMLNRRYGLFIDGGVCISMVRPVAERNDEGGYNGDHPHIHLRGQSGNARGSGIIMGMHSERDSITNGVQVDRWRGLRLQNGFVLRSKINFAADALDNIVESVGLNASVINGPPNIRRRNITA